MKTRIETLTARSNAIGSKKQVRQRKQRQGDDDATAGEPTRATASPPHRPEHISISPPLAFLPTRQELALKLQHSMSNNVRQTKALRDAAAMDFALGHKADLAVFAAFANGEELPGERLSFGKGTASTTLR